MKAGLLVHRFAALMILCTLVIPPLAFAASPSLVGTPFPLNQYTPGYQQTYTFGRSVAGDAAGNFVAVWQSDQASTGGPVSIRARAFNASGTALGDEFVVNTTLTVDGNSASPSVPAIAMSPDGNGVIVWESFGDGYSRGVFAQRITSTGQMVGPEFIVNQTTDRSEDQPSVAMHDDGSFIVVFERNNSGYPDVYGRRYDSQGNALGDEFFLSAYPTWPQRYVDVAVLPNGGFVAAWGAWGQDGNAYGIKARVFQSDGTPLAPAFFVNEYWSGAQVYPSIATSGNAILIVWEGSGIGDTNGIYGRRFDLTGTPLSSDFRVNTLTTNSQTAVSAAAVPDGGFFVTWSGNGVQGAAVAGQRLSADGTFDGAELAFLSGGYDPSTFINGWDGVTIGTAPDANEVGPVAQRLHFCDPPLTNPVISAPAAVCDNELGQASISGSFDSIAWSILNGTIEGPANEALVSFRGNGSWPITLNVTITTGTCQASDTVTIAETQGVNAPDPPTNLTASPTAVSRITLSWTAPGGSVHHYDIHRASKACGSGMPFVKIGTSTTTSLNDDTVVPGETYSYTVAAANAVDSCPSASSACDDAVAYGDCPTDPTFAGLAAVTANNCLLRLTWNTAPSNCTIAAGMVYNIYRSTSASFAPDAANRIARCVTSTFYDDINAPAGTNYYIVRAEDSSAGNGGPCNGGNEETNVVRRSGTMSTSESLTALYRDNFDGVRPAANPDAYWKETITAPAGNDQIAFSTCKSADAGTTYKFGPVGVCTGWYSSSSNQRLELGGDGSIDPAINGFVLPATGTVRLRFRHSYVFENNWDGAALYYHTTSVPSWTLVGESVSATAPYLAQGLYTGSANSSGTRVWTGTQSSFVEVIVNLDAVRGQTIWFSWRFTSDSSVNYDGYHLDDVIIETITPLSCDITGPVQAFTVTSRDGVNELEWLNPASTHYATTILRYRTDGVTPTTATDGLPVRGGTETGFADTYDSVEHTVTNGTAYRYAAFVQAANGLVGPARAAIGRAEPLAATKWIYNTGASAMTAPGIASIFAVSNDRILHSIQQGTAGGDWAPGWRPFAMNGPSQARPSVVSMNNNRINGAPKVAFIGSQDGYVYAVNAATGAELWGTQIGQMVQTAPSVALREYGIGLTTVDLIIAGTRNSAPPNGVYALNTQGGGITWSYTGGGTYTIGVIGGQVSIDYATRRIYFASRAASSSTNQNHTLWCLSFDDTTVTRVWSIPLGDIDGSPVLRNGTLYVGTNSGGVYAINPNDGSVLASLATDDGPIKGFPFPNSDGRIYFSTTNRVWSLTDSLSAPRSLSLNWSVSSIPAPSTAVLSRGSLYVGSSDGRLYKISQLTEPAPTIASTQLGSGLAAVGTIGYDYQNDLAYVGTAEGAIYAVSIP